MPRSSLQIVLAGLHFFTGARAFALSDFQPVLTNVHGQCERVYNHNIPGCSSSDFTGDSGCSRGCIAGLVTVNQDINEACQDFNAPDGSVIALFQQGQGIQRLCTIAVITASTSSIPAIGESTLTLPSTQATTASSILADTSSAPTPSSSSLPTGILTATGSPKFTTSSSSTTRSSMPVTTASTSTTSWTTLPPPSTLSSKPASSPGAHANIDGNSNTGGDPFAPSAAAFVTPGCAYLISAFVAASLSYW